MTQRLAVPALILVSAAAGAGLTVAYRANIDGPAASCRAGAVSMARIELLFGMGRKGGGEIGDAEWTAFLDAEVTPRFPDGLTVLSGNGQWRGDSGSLTKERSRVLLVWYKRATDSDKRIEAIRAAYKARFGQDSVMRVDGASCVSF